MIFTALSIGQFTELYQQQCVSLWLVFAIRLSQRNICSFTVPVTINAIYQTLVKGTRVWLTHKQSVLYATILRQSEIGQCLLSRPTHCCGLKSFLTINAWARGSWGGEGRRGIVVVVEHSVIVVLDMLQIRWTWRYSHFWSWLLRLLKATCENLYPDSVRLDGQVKRPECERQRCWVWVVTFGVGCCVSKHSLSSLLTVSDVTNPLLNEGCRLQSGKTAATGRQHTTVTPNLTETQCRSVVNSPLRRNHNYAAWITTQGRPISPAVFLAVGIIHLTVLRQLHGSRHALHSLHSGQHSATGFNTAKFCIFPTERVYEGWRKCARC